MPLELKWKLLFVKDLYPTYSHYLESLQASVQPRAIIFDTLVESLQNERKILGIGSQQLQPMKKQMCLAKKEKKWSL